jgi:hypothetical protein
MCRFLAVATPAKNNIFPSPHRAAHGQKKHNATPPHAVMVAGAVHAGNTLPDLQSVRPVPAALHAATVFHVCRHAERAGHNPSLLLLSRRPHCKGDRGSGTTDTKKPTISPCTGMRHTPKRSITMAWTTRHVNLPNLQINNSGIYQGPPEQKTQYPADSFARYLQAQPHDLHPVRRQQPEPPPPPYRHPSGPSAYQSLQWPHSVPSRHEMEAAYHMCMPIVLPPASESEAQTTGSPTPPPGCGSTADNSPRDDETAGFQNEGANMHSTEVEWERLLENLRSTGGPADDLRCPGGERKRRRSNASTRDTDGDLVEVQPKNRMLLPQSHRETCTSMWVVNSNDWMEVEHVIRQMLKCESSECSAFHSIGYIFFRSCAVSHVTAPSDYLKDGAQYHFPGTEVNISIVHAHEEGVLEVQCYLEYAP